MMHMEKITVIIPTYNEEASIGALLSSVLELPCDKNVIVVDDGSTDGTNEILQQIEGITVISHPYNIGNGAAVKTGIRNADTEYIVIIDADCQHRPEDIPRLVENLDEYDLVVGARMADSDSSFFRDFGNWVFIKLGSFLMNYQILDMTSGFRAFKRSCITKFQNLYPNGFSFPTTSTMCFLASGYRVKFVPVKSNIRFGGSSKISPLRDGVRFIAIIFRIIMMKPLKVFFPAGVISFMLGVLWTIRTVYLSSSVSVGGLMLLVFGINFLFFGFISDQILALRKDLIQKD